MIRMTPVFYSGVAGILDGVIQNADTNAATDRPEWYQKYALWYEAVLLLGGLMADNARMLSPDITEPIILAGGALIGKRLGEQFIKLQVSVPSYAVPYTVPHAAPSYGAVNKNPTATLV